MILLRCLLLSLILSVVLLLLPGTAAHAQVTKLPLLQNTLGGGDDPNKNLPRPEPTDLHGGWWHYFDIEDQAERQKRIESVIERLRALLTELPEANVSDAAAFVELIQANLQALPEARDQPTPKPPPPPAYAERYTLQQILNIAQRLRTTQARQKIMAVDVEAAERAVEASNEKLDTELAAYLDLSTSDPKRTMLGLRIMAERLSLILAQERLRVDKGERQATEVLIKQLSEEQAIARERLTAESDDLERLKSALLESEQNIEQAHAQTIRAQTGASKIIGNEPSDKATGAYRQQHAINAEVEEAAARLERFKLLTEQALVSLLLNADLDTEQLRDQLTHWEDELSLISKQAQVWRENSERERERTSNAMTREQIQTPENNSTQFIALLNQNRFSLAQETLLNIKLLQDAIAEINLIIQLVDSELLRKEGQLRDWLAWVQQRMQQVWAVVSAGINESLFKIGETPVTALGLLRIVLILTIAWLLSHWLRHALAKLGARGDGSNLPAYYTVGRLSHYLLIIIGFMVGLSSIGMDFTNFALVAGALAIGIGFGLQAIVNNFISGLILLFERSLKVGDFVELASGVTGEVKAINVRSTQIKTNENIDIVVPNSEFMNTNVINWTLQEPSRRVHYPFRVAFGFDKDIVRKAGLEAAEKVPHTLSGIPGKNPQVWLVGYGDNGYNFELVVWLTPSAVKRPQAVQAAYYWELETALRKYAVEVPVPQRDLRLRNGPGEYVPWANGSALVGMGAMAGERKN